MRSSSPPSISSPLSSRPCSPRLPTGTFQSTHEDWETRREGSVPRIIGSIFSKEPRTNWHFVVHPRSKRFFTVTVEETRARPRISPCIIDSNRELPFYAAAHSRRRSSSQQKRLNAVETVVAEITLACLEMLFAVVQPLMQLCDSPTIFHAPEPITKGGFFILAVLFQYLRGRILIVIVIEYFHKYTYVSVSVPS